MKNENKTVKVVCSAFRTVTRSYIMSNIQNARLLRTESIWKHIINVLAII